MKFVSEPNIDTKIRRMSERVRWQHPQIIERGIDQTRLQVQDAPEAFEAFSFLVLGDSGTGRHRRGSPQRQVAEHLMAKGQSARFVMHTGDVVYLVGSSEQYHANFIKPYREWLIGGESYRQIAYDHMKFKLPFFPVIGNHDYYDLPRLWGLVAGITGPLRYALRSFLDLDVGWHGSYQGDAFARAFLDYLRAVPEFRLAAHLDQHYTAELEGDRCLTYIAGEFNRLPNRYYTFRYAGIDFFALDSNTFNQPLPLEDIAGAGQSRNRLKEKRYQLEVDKDDLLKRRGQSMTTPMDEDDREDITEQIEEIDEQIHDIDKQLSATEDAVVDRAQLDWLRDRLITSWQNPQVRGRILLLHHPPYVTETTKWFQGQTLAVRHHLRRVLDDVAVTVGDTHGQPLVNLVLSGHAHCMEYLRTGDTGHGDAHLPWVVCGGSGYSLRRQRPEGPELPDTRSGVAQPVATSQLFMGRSGKGATLKRPYSGLRIDANSGRPLSLSVTPIISEKFEKRWHDYSLDPFTV